MAIEEVITYDYEVQEDTFGINVRRCTSYVDSDTPNVVISKTFHRYKVEPDDDWSSEPDKIKAICDAIFTDEVKAAWLNDHNYINSKKITSSKGGDDSDMKLDDDGNAIGPN
jgi:hypothetical protein